MEEKFINLLDKLLADIDDIDAQSPEKVVGLVWWVQMMGLRERAKDYRKFYKQGEEDD